VSMKIFTDLHIHSKYARGCSKDLVIENIVRNAKLKGLNLLGTGDFTHPLWLKELEENLKEFGEGVYTWRKDDSVFFILTTEVSTIFLRDGKIRRIHVLLGLPSFEKLKN
jgi:PHP family Zn ribbon phosphoesterase